MPIVCARRMLSKTDLECCLVSLEQHQLGLVLPQLLTPWSTSGIWTMYSMSSSVSAVTISPLVDGFFASCPFALVPAIADDVVGRLGDPAESTRLARSKTNV